MRGEGGEAGAFPDRPLPSRLDRLSLSIQDLDLLLMEPESASTAVWLEVVASDMMD